MRPSRFRVPVTIALAALILLGPALFWGRPFIFYDTPVYWGWGKDVVGALQHPWPRAGAPWIPGRPLFGWELGAHGATLGDLRFTLTAIEARSIFYAVPLYLLAAAGGLWLVAALQALAAALVLRTSVRALAPALGEAAFLAVTAALVLLTAVGFEACDIMPDLFGGLAVLAAAVLIARPERLSRAARLGLAAVAGYAVLAHAENGLNLAAAAAFGVVFFAREGMKAALLRVAPVAGALAAAAIVGLIGHAGVEQAFGRPSHPAPFLVSRLAADGAVQRYLAKACSRPGLASCDLAQIHADYPEYYLALYPLSPPPDLANAASAYDRLQSTDVSDASAARRERFLAEGPRLVAGALTADGPHLAALALARGGALMGAGAVGPNFDSFAGLMRERTQRARETAAITPGAADCGRTRAASCGPLAPGPLAAIQTLALLAGLAALGGCLLLDAPEARDLRAFAAQILFLLMANALICGALSGLYERYQIRVAWLAPFVALVALASGLVRRRARATLPSPVPGIVPPIAAVQRRPS
ncbi:MAG TPA: hypothetical protein VKU90_05720 [Caulobacteraceae bacterium]|nr:hypothetical protein [Caulobacteraceae bacterium]